MKYKYIYLPSPTLGRVLLCSYGANSKFDSGKNLRKVKIFGIIYIENEVKLKKYYRRNDNNERI